MACPPHIGIITVIVTVQNMTFPHFQSFCSQFSSFMGPNIFSWYCLQTIKWGNKCSSTLYSHFSGDLSWYQENKELGKTIGILFFAKKVWIQSFRHFSYNDNRTRGLNNTPLKCCLPSTDAIDRREKKFRYAYEGARSHYARRASLKST